MSTLDYNEELILLNELNSKNHDAFSWLCKEYSEDLLILAYTILGDASLASKKVEQLFTGLWATYKPGLITIPIYKYLSIELRKLCQSKND